LLTLMCTAMLNPALTGENDAVGESSPKVLDDEKTQADSLAEAEEPNMTADAVNESTEAGETIVIADVGVNLKGEEAHAQTEAGRESTYVTTSNTCTILLRYR
jgi:hypothetical protein